MRIEIVRKLWYYIYRNPKRRFHRMDAMQKTIHYNSDRKDRIDFIKNVVGVGTIIDKFIVDRGHPNGAEIHSITDNGIIIIQNKNTEKLVTMLIARPQQIKRYYIAENKPIPLNVVRIAYEHLLKGYNEI